jgi:4'-phosphopantetheinyl transferase
MVLLGFSAGEEIGVDIERHDPFALTAELLSAVFTIEERTELASLAPEDRVKGFYRAWTRKEAFIKATGEGLSADLQSFSVTLNPEYPPSLRLTAKYPCGQWNLHSLDTGPDYEAAIVFTGPDLPVFLKRV